MEKLHGGDVRVHLGNRTRCQGNLRREPKQRSHERLGEYAFYEYFRYCEYKATERYLNVLFAVLLKRVLRATRVG